MSFVIAQEAERSKQAYSLQRRADLDLVGLVSAASKCRHFEDVVFPLKFWLEYEPHTASVSGQRLTAPVQFKFQVVDDKDTEAVSFLCVFRADYNLSEGYQPTPEEISAFTESNAIFNCWPYFRELVQSTLSRMNYPPLSIPFLRLAPKPLAATQPTQAELESMKMLEGPAKVAEQGATKKKGRRKTK
jgi:hypothetical protein